MTPAHTIHAHDAAEHFDVPIETVSNFSIESPRFLSKNLGVDEEMMAGERGARVLQNGDAEARVGPSILLASGGIRWLGRGSS